MVIKKKSNSCIFCENKREQVIRAKKQFKKAKSLLVKFLDIDFLDLHGSEMAESLKCEIAEFLTQK